MSKTLRNLSDIEYGASPKQIRSNDFTTIGIYGTGGQIGYSNEVLFKGPLVVVARKGTLDNPIYVADNCWVIDTAYAVLPKTDVDAKWLYYNLKNFDLKKLNESTGVPSISRDYLYRVSFEYFPLPEQRKISRVLSSVDSIIEKTEAAIAKYKAVKVGMMKDLFTRGIDLDTGKLRPNYEKAPELYKESKLGWIPKEWDVDILSKYTVTYAGGTPSRSRSDYFGGSIPWVSSSEVNNPKIYQTKETITQEGLDNSSAKWVKSGSVLIAMYGATAGKISRLFIDATTNQAVLACLDNKDLRARYLYYVMSLLKDQILFKVQGSGQPNLSKDIIDKTLLLIPSPDEQVFISQRLEKIDSVIEFEEYTCHKYQQLKQALMSDLLTGKVRVKYEENNVEYKEDKVEYEEDKMEAV